MVRAEPLGRAAVFAVLDKPGTFVVGVYLPVRHGYVLTHRVGAATAANYAARYLIEPAVDSTGRCNTVGFGCCLDRRCASGEAGSSRRVVRGEQEGAVGEVEGRGVHKRHRPGITQG